MEACSNVDHENTAIETGDDAGLSQRCCPRTMTASGLPRANTVSSPAAWSQ